MIHIETEIPAYRKPRIMPGPAYQPIVDNDNGGPVEVLTFGRRGCEIPPVYRIEEAEMLRQFAVTGEGWKGGRRRGTGSCAPRTLRGRRLPRPDTATATREGSRIVTVLLNRCWVVDDPEDLPRAVKRDTEADEREEHDGVARAERAREGGAA